MRREGTECADFQQFFTRTSPDMLARAQMLCGHQHDAEDAVQEAYIQALRCWGRIRRYERPDLWVYTIMKQRLWATRRRWWSRQRTVGLEIASPSTASAEQTAQARAVLDVLDSLPPRQRQVAVRYYLEDRSQDDIAEELGISRGAVGAHLFKARDNMRKKLGITGRIEDALMAGGRPAFSAAGAAAGDRLSNALRATHAWLCLAAKTDQQVLARIYDTVIREADRDGKPT